MFLILLLVLLLLFIFLLLLELFQKRKVLFGVFLIGPACQRFLVGCYGFVQLAFTRQRITAVVPAVGIIYLGELVGCGFVVTALVGCGARPTRIFEQCCRFFTLVLLHCPLTLLVRGQPQIVPYSGACRLGLGSEQQGQQADNPSAAKQSERQRQQGQNKEVALVLPGIGRTIQCDG